MQAPVRSLTCILQGTLTPEALMPNFVPLALAALLLAAPSARAAAAPAVGWSEITGERGSHASANRGPVTIRRVDGQPVVDRRARYAPGPHVVIVQWMPKRGLRTSDRTLRLDLKACKRYVINAQFASQGSSLWQAVVDRVDDIPGCRGTVSTDALPARVGG
jgi:hypothetical protein